MGSSEPPRGQVARLLSCMNAFPDLPLGTQHLVCQIPGHLLLSIFQHAQSLAILQVAHLAWLSARQLVALHETL